MGEAMTDRDREFEARKFFWSVMETLDQAPVSVEVAQRAIRKIAEALPPFTPIPPQSGDNP